MRRSTVLKLMVVLSLIFQSISASAMVLHIKPSHSHPIMSGMDAHEGMMDHDNHKMDCCDHDSSNHQCNCDHCVSFSSVLWQYRLTDIASGTTLYLSTASPTVLSHPRNAIFKPPRILS